MKRLPHLLPRVGLVLIATGSVVFTALPVMRHAAGIIVLAPGAPAIAVPAEAPDHVDLTPLLERAPFGRAASTAPSGQSTAGTKPDFVLRGVFSTLGAPSAALLAVDGETDRYREGQAVTASYLLSQVAVDHVVLTGKGGTITLRFDGQDTDGANQQADGARSGPIDLIARLGRGLVVPARAQRSKPPETTSEYIDYWRKRIRKNPKAVLDEIGLTPGDDGYVIADRHDVGVRLAGLKAGDLVRSVNGRPVGNPDDDRRFYDRIAASGQARLEVERNGRVMTFSFPLR